MKVPHSYNADKMDKVKRPIKEIKFHANGSTRFAIDWWMNQPYRAFKQLPTNQVKNSNFMGKNIANGVLFVDLIISKKILDTTEAA